MINPYYEDPRTVQVRETAVARERHAYMYAYRAGLIQRETAAELMRRAGCFEAEIEEALSCESS